MSPPHSRISGAWQGYLAGLYCHQSLPDWLLRSRQKDPQILGEGATIQVEAAADLGTAGYPDDSVRGWARRSAIGTNRRLALGVGSLWLLLTGVQVAALGAKNLFGTNLGFLLWALVALPALVWNAIRSNSKWGWLILVIAQYVSVLQILVHRADIAVVGVMAYWIPLAFIVLAQLVLPSRAAIGVTLSTALGSATALVISLRSGQATDTWIMPATGIAYSLTVGLAASFANKITVMADKVDQATTALVRQRVLAHKIKRIEAETAEVARVVHDSAINTFSAIASGRLASDATTIQMRCGKDVATLTGLLSQDTQVDAADAAAELRESANDEGIELTFVGVTAERLSEILAGLPEPVSRAIRGSVCEAVRNTAKYSTVLRSTLLVKRDEALHITISDDGIGFAGDLPADRGIQRSIIDRCREVGVEASVWSVPGQGTRVTLSYAPDAIKTPDDSDQTVTEFLIDAVWAIIGRITVAMLAACVSLSTIHARGALPGPIALLLVLLIATSCLVYWRCHGTLEMPTWLVVLLIAEVPIAIITAELKQPIRGAGAITAWSTTACVPMLVSIILLSRRPWPLLAVMVCYFGSYGWLATLPNEPGSQKATPTFGAIGAAMALAVWASRRKLWALTAEASAANAATNRARLQAVEAEAALRVRSVRSIPVLRSSLQLLNDLADGTLSPHDQGVMARCLNEESYLRELTLLNPALTNLGEWLAQALATAHEREVSLRIRSINDDVPSGASAAFLGQVLLAATATTQRSGQLSFGLSRRGGMYVASMVGDVWALQQAADSLRQAHPAWTLSFVELDDEALLELSESGQLLSTNGAALVH